MDPQHRLLIELTREAIQDAGMESAGFDGTDVSVIMGISENGYRDIAATNLRLRQLVAGEFGVAPDDPSWSVAGAAVERLRGTSVSLVAVEERFGVSIPDEEASRLRTVGDAVMVVERLFSTVAG